jgi:16S rRNA (uracil1498-N3)-methyltransferase
MQVHRFYAHPEEIGEETILLSAEESHHLARVLRVRTGTRVLAFDGRGQEWECQVVESHPKASRLNIEQRREDVVESSLSLTLAQSLLKGDKFDLVVQKATELGVTQIIPLLTDHSEARLGGERREQRRQRWQRISLEALKQCGRRRLVTISDPVAFSDLCRSLAGEPAWLLAERSGGAAPPRQGQADGLTLLIGPEGGWSDSELTLAQDSAIPLVHLGPRILRTETAAITAVALAQFLHGDLSS